MKPIDSIRKNLKLRFCFAHAILAITYIIIIAYIYFTPSTQDEYHLRLTYGEEITTAPQLYYDLGQGYSESQSIFASCEGKAATFSLNDTIRENVVSYRFDPISGMPCELGLHSLSIILNDEEIETISGNALKNLMTSTNHIDNIRMKQVRCRLLLL